VHVSDERTEAAETTLDRAREAVAGNTLTDTPDVELIDQNVWIDSGVGKAIVRFAEDGSYDHTW
jgi:hypothetical protein